MFFGTAGGLQAIALVNHTSTAAATTTVTTPAINCLGATGLVVAVSWNTALGVAPTISDSSSNTWHAVTQQTFASSGGMQMSYSYNATTTSSQTFSATNAGGVIGVTAGCFNYIKTTSANDQTNGATTGAGTSTTTQPGSITPTQANELVVTCFAYNTPATITVPSGYSAVDSQPFNGSTNFGINLAWEVQTTATTTNPTWTSSVASSNAASIQSLFHQ